MLLCNDQALLAKCESSCAGKEVAGRTGLEPAASGVTGRRYNQLNYHPAKTKTVAS